MLALSLAQSGEDADKARSADLYRTLIGGQNAEAADFAALASLLVGLGDYGAAKEAVLGGIKQFPEAIEGYLKIGQTIVEATGDRSLRDDLSALRAGGRKA